jgi:hypothetical protein
MLVTAQWQSMYSLGTQWWAREHSKQRGGGQNGYGVTTTCIQFLYCMEGIRTKFRRSAQGWWLCLNRVEFVRILSTKCPSGQGFGTQERRF